MTQNVLLEITEDMVGITLSVDADDPWQFYITHPTGCIMPMLACGPTALLQGLTMFASGISRLTETVARAQAIDAS